MLHALVHASVREKTGKLAKIICIHVVFIAVMMNELLKIQRDLGSPQQQQRQQQAAVLEEDAANSLSDPNDWLADLPKFGIYHRGYTTSHWLQVFRPL